MHLNELMDSKHITKYRLAKESGVPYSTVSDICSGKTQLEKCSAETVYRISQILGVSMESLIEPQLQKRSDFELFKSNTCHRLHVLGDIDFVIEILEQDEIRDLYKRQWYRESLYLLAMLDYVSRENDIPICNQYADIRNMKLKETIYPASVLTESKVFGNDEPKLRAVREAIPEFMRFNIVENEVRNVI